MNTQDTRDLAGRSIHIGTELPGPRAREMIAAATPHMSPSLIHVYPLMVKRAAGCMVEDVDGNVFLDVQAGVATASTGHCHPSVAAAVKEQVDTLVHMCGTDFHYPGYGELSRRLSRLAPGGTDDWQVFLTNSGTEGVEAAIKLARHHTGRSQLIAFRGGFHGRSLGALSLTASKPKYREGFGPLLPGVSHATFPARGKCPVGKDHAECYVACLTQGIERDLFSYTVSPREVAAIVVEPVQGEGGYVVPPRAFLQRLRELCTEHGILLVFDEVQSGMGRTGKMFAAEHFGVVPDIIVLAKGLASGFPLGVMMARRELMTWPAGSHGSTCGGNPVCIAAALATLDLLEGGLCDNAARVGAHFQEALRTALAGVPIVTEVRGLGLMIGIELTSAKIADAVSNRCWEKGLLVLECGKKAIRMSPPLVITKDQVDVAVRLFAAACREVSGSGTGSGVASDRNH